MVPTKMMKSFRSIDICATSIVATADIKDHLYRFPKGDNPLLEEWISKVGNPALEYYDSSTLRCMDVCADHFLPVMFKPNPTENTNKKKKLKKNAIPEPPKNLLTNEEKEDVQASQLVIKQQLMREEGEEEKEHQHHHYHYQQQQEAEEREVEEEGENELFINKRTLNYTKVPLKFSDKENSMECLAVEPQTNCDVQLENWTRKTFGEMQLKKECAQLLKKNKDLRVQIKYLKRNFEKIKRSRDRFREMLRTVETNNEFLDRHGCENDTTCVKRALVKTQLESESIKYTTEKRDECEESN